MTIAASAAVEVQPTKNPGDVAMDVERSSIGTGSRAIERHFGSERRASRPMVSVLLLEEFAVVRDGLRLVIEAEPQFEDCAAVPTLAQAGSAREASMLRAHPGPGAAGGFMGPR